MHNSTCEEGATRSIVARLIGSTEGVTAAEYGLIVGLVAIVVIAALVSLGSNLSSMFMQIGVDL
ncbi:MAG TPA: Flp family type IVb pilin [Stellaceae bacterium]